jgi:hypothetical protein
MLVSELVWEKRSSGGLPYYYYYYYYYYYLSQLLHCDGDDRDWRIQHCLNWNYDGTTYPDVWYIEHRLQDKYFSGSSNDGHATMCLAELGCWLTQFTPKGNNDGTSSEERMVRSQARGDGAGAAGDRAERNAGALMD